MGAGGGFDFFGREQIAESPPPSTAIFENPADFRIRRCAPASCGYAAGRNALRRPEPRR
jgi:hypothetical protein